MNQMTDDQKLNKFADILDSSEYVVFLGGAGVSTESGIPDFRSKNGLYHRKNKKFSEYKPEYLLVMTALSTNRKYSLIITGVTLMQGQ